MAIVLSYGLQGQDSHYYSIQPDSKGTLDGGTGTAGSRGLSAVFYNPGIISLFEKSNIGISGSLYSVDFVKVREGTGEFHDLSGNSFQVIPSIFAGTFKSKKNKKITMAYAYFNTGSYNNRLSTEFVEVFEKENSSYMAYRYDIRTRYSEDWVGAGISYRINESLGLGIIPYAHFYTIQFMQRSHIDVSADNDINNLVFGIGDFRESRLFSPGLLLNMGLVYNKGNHEFGLTVITPRINVLPLAYSSVERSITEYNDSNDIKRAILDDADFKARIKRPWEINLGYAFLHKNKAFKIRASLYTGNDKYVMGEESGSSIRIGGFQLPNQHDFLPVTSNQMTLNIGVGYEWNVKDDLKMVLGYRTDFSYFNKGDYSYIDFTTVLIHWDLHHISAGVNWQYKWLKLNTGIDYAFSYQKGISQFVDLDSFLDGNQNNIKLSDQAQVRYNQFKVLIGVVLSLNSSQ